MLKANKKYSATATIKFSTSQNGCSVLYNLVDKETGKGIGCYQGRKQINANVYDSDVECFGIIILEKDTKIALRIDAITGDEITSIGASISIQEIGQVITIDPLEHVNNSQGIEDTPVGHIISHMGTVAPKHYLICDGAEYNIIDYPYLAQHMIDSFGSVNYFGGDGTTTFAVPDLRGEFLRGTGINSHEEQGNGANVGEHQDYIVSKYYGTVGWSKSSPWNVAKINNEDGTYTTVLEEAPRPTNTSVLYCIKYEPTYYMNVFGLREETVLFEGEITKNGTYELTDSVDNYDSVILIEDTSESNLLKEVLINQGMYSTNLGMASGNSTKWYIYGTINFNNNIATVERLGSGGYTYKLCKIIGIKYRNTTEGTVISGGQYSEEELQAAIIDIVDMINEESGEVITENTPAVIPELYPEMDDTPTVIPELYDELDTPTVIPELEDETEPEGGTE